jgi:alkylation response protein AidB-like acyl-CoA dehydrogenase
LGLKTHLVEQLKVFLLENIEPYAQQLDTDASLMRKTLIRFKNEGLFSMYVPDQYGGTELSLDEKIRMQEIFGLFGGAFSFLQVQAGSASWLIQQGDNEILKHELLPKMASGAMSIGNCTYQLKLPTRNHFPGKASPSGYKITGKLMLCSGYEMLDELVIGFHLE